MILEYLAGGDLLGYLRKSRGYKDSYNSGEYVSSSKLREQNLLSFAWMIADGMAHLAENKVYYISNKCLLKTCIDIKNKYSVKAGP